MRWLAIALLSLVLTACAGSEEDVSGLPDLPEITVSEFEAHLAEDERPAVVNIWASWCLPCRSEAPLLDQAHAEYGDRIEFIGVAVQDSQVGAKQFLAEFGLDFDHFFDRNRSIPNHYGAFGTPVTLFFGPTGELVHRHNGVIDERTLAINLDELNRLGH